MVAKTTFWLELEALVSEGISAFLYCCSDYNNLFSLCNDILVSNIEKVYDNFINKYILGDKNV